MMALRAVGIGSICAAMLASQYVAARITRRR